jgi:hypothetical protein
MPKAFVFQKFAPLGIRVFEPGGRRFDYPAPRRLGRRRFSGGGPERSGGRAAQSRAQRRIGAERPKGGPEGVGAQRE